MKKLLLILLIFQLNSCDGIFGISDYASPAKNINDAKKNNLLKNTYVSSKKKVIIDSEEYEIVEAWTSYRFKTNKSTEKNKSFYEFLIIIRNNKTKEVSLSARTTPTYSKFIKYYCKYFEASGSIETDKLCLLFDSKKFPDSPNIIKVGFKSGGKEDITIFKKND
ncbi:hypothetical protein [Flavobacterium sp. CAU 1735]|uniref:hypothetical protein n=1 Tax=Flavobacterium sp. CAU 1735 TaxID=3140361 RepID=UPI0032617E79